MATPKQTAPELTRNSLDNHFTRSARRYPDRTALFVGGKHYSYAQVSAESDRIARTLRAGSASAEQRNVGLIYARSMSSYAALLAIMRSKDVYVPLNPKAPAERLLNVIRAANIAILIVDGTDVLSNEVIDALKSSRHLRIITNGGHSLASAGLEIDETALEIPDFAASESDQPASLAYILYTSGSTGEPKGVAITHESAYRSIERHHQLLGTNEQDRFTQFSALSFDTSVMELFLCWRSGATLFVPDASEAPVPFQFAVTHAITVWTSVPSLASTLLKLSLLKENALPDIALTLLCGEALPSELAHAWANAAPGSRIFNLYGPTEVTITSTYYEFDRHSDPRQGMVPIGIPLQGLRYMILDEGQIVQEDDVPGELWLTGEHLAAGYWGNPDATQAAFVRFPPGDPEAPMWYRTGDLVSRRSGVGLLFRGRLDRQVKLRGQRIELQAIESVLRELTGSAQVAVVPLRRQGLCESIVAYCDQLNNDEATVKTHCLKKMPRYMVPDRIFQLSTFPISSHGKIDYLALAARAAVHKGPL